MSYTKGPWQQWRRSVITPTGRDICEIKRPHIPWDAEDDANMALIISAPEQQAKIDALLAGCKAAERFLRDVGFYGSPMDGIIGDIVSQLSTAIAKAEA